MQSGLNYRKAVFPFANGDDYLIFGINGKRPILIRTLQSQFRKVLEIAKIDTKNRNLVISIEDNLNQIAHHKAAFDNLF
ncbi:MAG: hypothetical protein CVV48_11335 [Spirochaetae bacterium HGW-Spirochaetae-4]|jgi:hypothetical protein|nr:MAG: hypothetical protein CVV48_11335 [Spirochaetae bacterium HGW-Spirochaetae-4]